MHRHLHDRGGRTLLLHATGGTTDLATGKDEIGGPFLSPIEGTLESLGAEIAWICRDDGRREPGPASGRCETVLDCAWPPSDKLVFH